MIRSYGLTLSALTLRAWKFTIVEFLRSNPMDVYIVVVGWLGWILNLILGEYIIRRKNVRTADIYD